MAISPPSPSTWSRCACVKQDVLEPAEPAAGAQQLALRALAAIDQIALAAGADEQCRQPALPPKAWSPLCRER